MASENYLLLLIQFLRDRSIGPSACLVSVHLALMSASFQRLDKYPPGPRQIGGLPCLLKLTESWPDSQTALGLGQYLPGAPGSNIQAGQRLAIWSATWSSWSC